MEDLSKNEISFPARVPLEEDCMLDDVLLPFLYQHRQSQLSASSFPCFHMNVRSIISFLILLGFFCSNHDNPNIEVMWFCTFSSNHE